MVIIIIIIIMMMMMIYTLGTLGTFGTTIESLSKLLSSSISTGVTHAGIKEVSWRLSGTAFQLA